MPVGEIHHGEERQPFLPLNLLHGNPHKRRPAGLAGMGEQLHARLCRGLSALFLVALIACADNIFPGALASVGAGDDVVNTQFIAGKCLAAVLAAVFIPAENVDAGETHLPVWHFIVGEQQNDAGNAYGPVHQPDTFVLGMDPEFCPAFKVKGLVLLVDGPCYPLVEQNKCSA